LKAHVARLVHLTHTARTGERHNFVRAELASGVECHDGYDDNEVAL
jgi:hypothetical protein